MRIQGVYVRCIPTHHQWIYRETTQVREWKDIPNEADPADIEMIGTDLWELLHSSEAQICRLSTIPAATFDDFVSRLPP
jgi:hypothetical protein